MDFMKHAMALPISRPSDREIALIMAFYFDSNPESHLMTEAEIVKLSNLARNTTRAALKRLEIAKFLKSTTPNRGVLMGVLSWSFKDITQNSVKTGTKTPKKTDKNDTHTYINKKGQKKSHSERGSDRLTGTGEKKEVDRRDFIRFTDAYPPRADGTKGLFRAEDLWNKLIEDGVDPEQIIQAAWLYRTKEVCSTYRIRMDNWLKDRLFLDYTDQAFLFPQEREKGGLDLLTTAHRRMVENGTPAEDVSVMESIIIDCQLVHGKQSIVLTLNPAATKKQKLIAYEVRQHYHPAFASLLGHDIISVVFSDDS